MSMSHSGLLQAYNGLNLMDAQELKNEKFPIFLQVVHSSETKRYAF